MRMIVRQQLTGLFLACAAVFATVPVGAQQASRHGFADLVFTNGKVITVDPRDTIGPQTQVVDLKGRALLPGFIDAHSHVEGMANVEAHYINIQVPPLKDGKAVIAKLEEAQAKKPPGAWLIGQGTYNKLMPTRAELDAAFDSKAVLSRSDLSGPLTGRTTHPRTVGITTTYSLD